MSLPGRKYKPAIARQETKEIVVFDELSSGEQQILTLLIKISALAGEGVTVLIDEPEISMHVAWQRRLPPVLRKLVGDLNSAVVVATHSPVLIASATHPDDHCFVMDRGEIGQELSPERRRSVEAILFEGFDTYTSFTHHVQELCAQVVSRVVTDADGTEPTADNGAPDIQVLKSLKTRLAKEDDEIAKRDLALVEKAMAAVEAIYQR